MSSPLATVAVDNRLLFGLSPKGVALPARSTGLSWATLRCAAVNSPAFCFLSSTCAARLVFVLTRGLLPAHSCLKGCILQYSTRVHLILDLLRVLPLQ